MSEPSGSPDWAALRSVLRLYVGLKFNKVPGLRWAARRIIWGISEWREKVRQERSIRLDLSISE